MNYLPTFFISLLLLVTAAALLIKFTTKLAYKIHISPLIVGSTLIAVGTSLPETSVAVSSLLQKVPNLSMGDIIGSNIVNICLVLGLSILLFPVRIGTEKTQRNNLVMLLATILFITTYFLPIPLRSYSGYALIIFYVLFIIVEIVWGKIGSLKEDKKALNKIKDAKGNTFAYLAGVIICLAALIGSSRYLVSSAIKIAVLLKVKEEIIGFSLIAFGTSIPELATSIISGLKKEWKIINGDIQGSNIYNLSVIGAVLIINTGINYQPYLLSLCVLLATTLLIFYLTIKFKGASIPRIYGLGFIAIYISYLYLIY